MLDIVGNSVRAGATLVEVSIHENSKEDTLKLSIIDNGCGMDQKIITQALDPFFTSRKTRKVGLGIPLLQQNAQLSGGDISIQSEPGKGTEINANFVRSHIDRPPLGDVAGTISLIVGGNPSVDFTFQHIFDGEEYLFDSREIKQILDGVEITEPKVINFIKQMIEENLHEIGVEF
jgi:signal transduction histidine kinase